MLRATRRKRRRPVPDLAVEIPEYPLADEDHEAQTFGCLLTKVGLFVALVGLSVRGLLNHPRLNRPLHHLSGEPSSKRYSSVTLTGAMDPMDAFGIAAQHSFDHESSPIIEPARKLRQEFADEYGGQDWARSLLQRGVPVSVTQKLAAFLVDRWSSTTTTLHMVVLGDVSAAGSGNYRGQAYAAVIERQLRSLLVAMNKELVVDNLASDGSTPLPLAWCLDTLLGIAPDILVFDFSDSRQLESFLQSTMTFRPFYIFRQLSQEDQAVVARYQRLGLKALVIDDTAAVEPFLSIEERFRPPGLSEWSKLGVPHSLRESHAAHGFLTRQQHELIAWLVTASLLAAFELAEVSRKDPWVLGSNEMRFDFPRAINSSMMVGLEDPSKRLCYTSFDWTVRSSAMEPDPSHAAIPGNLFVLVDSETAGSMSDLMIAKPDRYRFGWVFDLDTETKRVKMRSKDDSFLGFPDWKAAYYGLAQSKPLHLFVPVGGPDLKDYDAHGLFRHLVLCESDAPKKAESCSILRDVAVLVEGKQANLSAAVDKCVKLAIPPSTFLSPRAENYGLSIEVAATNSAITLKDGPCSIAHLIYELK